MSINEKIENLKGKLIVSCQALPNEPLHSPFIMGRMALAAKIGGASGIRANTKEDIAEIQTQVDEFFHKVKKKYPEQLFMADCSTIEEALHADELGFDFIGTTMVGYTKQSEGDKIEENDFEILREIVSKVNHKVIAEGNINTPEKARRVLKLGAYSVVVGSIITRPQLITKSFVEAIEK